MKSGEEKTVVVHPKDAFGEREPELVKLVPLKVFKANGINPAPGLVVVLENNLPGRVQTVSGGRVRVDFNHELAGRTLEYELKIDEKLTDEKEKIKALFELVFPRMPVKELKIARKEKELELVLPKDCTKLADLQARKLTLIKYLKKCVGEDKIQITEEY
jgi:FKBP-type peptidyl-prolyl cis-trans isomerase SlyD